jgi:hypothetical protein
METATPDIQRRRLLPLNILGKISALTLPHLKTKKQYISKCSIKYLPNTKKRV